MAKDIRAGRAFIEVLLRDKVGGALLGVQRKLDGFARGVATVGGRLAIGAGLLGAPLAGAAQHFAAYASGVDDVAQRTGAAPRAVQTLGYAAQLTGAEFADVEPALLKWQRNLAEATATAGPARAKFEDLGLDVGKLASVGVDEQFAAIADALAKLSGAERTAAAMELLGKSGAKLIPMLSGGAAGLSQYAREADRLGVVLADETIAAGAELGDALDRLRIAGSALTANVGAALAPQLLELAQVLVGTVGGVNQWIQAHPELVRGLALAALGAAGTAVALLTLAGAAKLAAFGLTPLILGTKLAAGSWALFRAGAASSMGVLSLLAKSLQFGAAGMLGLGRATANVAAGGATRSLQAIEAAARAAARGLWSAAQAVSSAAVTGARTAWESAAGSVRALWAATRAVPGVLMSAGRAVANGAITLWSISRAGMAATMSFVRLLPASVAAGAAMLRVLPAAIAADLSAAARAARLAAAGMFAVGASALIAAKYLALSVARQAAAGLAQLRAGAVYAAMSLGGMARALVAVNLAGARSFAAGVVRGTTSAAAGARLAASALWSAARAGAMVAAGGAAGALTSVATSGRQAAVHLWGLARAGISSAATFARSTYQAAAAQLRSLWTGAQAAASGLWNVARAGVVAAAASVRAGAAAAIAGVASLASWQMLAGLLVAGGVAWFVYSGAAEQSLASIAYSAGYAGETLRSSFERARPIVIGLFRSWWSTFATTWGGIRDSLAAGDLGAAAGIAFAGLKVAGIQGLMALEMMFGQSISGIARLIASGQWGQALRLVGAELGLVWRETTLSLSNLWGEFWTGAVTVLDNAATGIRNAWGDVIAWLSRMLLTAWQAIDTAYSRVAKLLGATSAGSGLDFDAARKTVDEDNSRAAAARNQAAEDRASARAADLTRQQADIDEERRRVAELRQTLRAGAAAAAGPLDDALLVAQVNLEKARADAAAKRKAIESPPGGAPGEDPASAVARQGDRVTQTFSAAAAVLLGAGGGPEKKIEANTARTARAVEKIAGWGPPPSLTFT